ncbi:TOMM precursor leader peptide-binding protein [Undibacterium sp. CY18W]|uniref:TOMM leader peptide-binding protein n=1 Tax=Undibacterium hunanense TaxID=2762292 RepID=A0ABR6ZT69_9BURK|nr:TOMM precursor leader peptide-binding protein [Undibacterium hunanense]MBC3919057.1 TOMM precursor leader peptide-binding protein [Undibacterium hunanense]
MMKKLQLSPAATITPNAQGVLLQSDLGDFQLHGKDVRDFVNNICPLLQGQYSQTELCTQLPGYADASIIAVVDLLKKHGLLEEIDESNQFSPPWSPHERFLKAWQHPDKKSTDDLSQARLLVIGLEPWSVKMIDELANAGIGHLHLLDNESLTKDDVLCHRPFGSEHIGQARADILQTILAQQAPWCKVTTGRLALGEQKQLTVTDESEWDLVIVSLSKEAQFWLHKASEYIDAGGYQALFGCLDGLESWIGPWVIPSQTSCWNCLRLRRLGTAHQPSMAHELDKVATDSQQTSRARTLLSPMAVMVGQQMSMEVLKLLLRYTTSTLDGQVRVQNLVTGESEQHKIIPMPWCEICGHQHELRHQDQPRIPATSVGQLPQFGAMSAVASYEQPGSNPLNHVTTVEQLKKLLAGWIDPVTGIIRQLSGHALHLPDFPVTASAGMSTFSAGKFDPRSMGQIGSGKGLDDISAHISAIGEAIERYSAARYNMRDFKYANVSELRGDYVDPEKLVLYSKRQYSTPNFPFSPWRAKQKIHWTKGHWLGLQKPVWVPALVSYFNFASPYEEQFSQVSSNGLAAGQNNDDAAIRATYELIERDAMMLTWYAQLPCQRLSLDSQYHGKMRLMIDDLTGNGIQLELYLLDVGIHVPTVVCLGLGDGISTPAVSVALATHGDIQVAMRKALLEQGHVMPYLCHLMRSGHKIPQQVHEVQTLEDHAAYYFSSNKLGAFDFMRQPASMAMDASRWPYPDVQNAEDLRQRLLAANVDVAIVDVTAPDVALSPFRVARAVGIHMQPIHFGEQFKRIDNPRLRKLLKGRIVNNNPHPIA